MRHCQSAGHTSDAPLTEEGLRQAESLAEFLSEMRVDAIACSAYTRAQQSIGPLAERLGLAIRVDPRLNERRLATDPGDGWRDLIRDSFRDLDLRAPGGESGREVLDRAWAALNELLDGRSRLPVVATHGNLMALVLNSLDPGFGFNGWEALSNPDVFLLNETEPGRIGFERLRM